MNKIQRFQKYIGTINGLLKYIGAFYLVCFSFAGLARQAWTYYRPLSPVESTHQIIPIGAMGGRTVYVTALDKNILYTLYILMPSLAAICIILMLIKYYLENTITEYKIKNSKPIALYNEPIFKRFKRRNFAELCYEDEPKHHRPMPCKKRVLMSLFYILFSLIVFNIPEHYLSATGGVDVIKSNIWLYGSVVYFWVYLFRCATETSDSKLTCYLHILTTIFVSWLSVALVYFIRLPFAECLYAVEQVGIVSLIILFVEFAFIFYIFIYRNRVLFEL